MNIEITRYEKDTSKIITLNFEENPDLELMANDKINIKRDNLKDQTCSIELKERFVFLEYTELIKGLDFMRSLRKLAGLQIMHILMVQSSLRKDVEMKYQIGQEKLIEDEKKRFVYDQSHLEIYLWTLRFPWVL